VNLEALYTMKSLFWFRKDLRLQDLDALGLAVRESSALGAFFAIPKRTWHRHRVAPGAQAFVFRQLKSLKENLCKRGIPFWVFEVEDFDEERRTLLSLCQKEGIKKVYATRELEWDERKRDEKTLADLKDLGIPLILGEDSCIHPPGSILTKEGKPFLVFSAFKRAWLSTPKPPLAQPLLDKVFTPFGEPPDRNWESLSDHELGDLWVTGEEAALARLRTFAQGRPLTRYEQDREIPGLMGTSQLSPYLARGVISPRRCYGEAQKIEGSTAWINELIWRDFYRHVLYLFPRVSRNRAFLEKTERLAWQDPKTNDALDRWITGQTGFPLVDAGMNQLREMGWMHNRVRMVTASFLTKTLGIHWRLGEDYFMSQLVDGDLAANNGGWQWSASTGTDSVPYFRIFNPIRQSERFDPDGIYIRRFCPELAHIKGKKIHLPYRPGGAPPLVLDLAQAHRAAIRRFQEIK
jgi:deoxyribodipyrimidine photo-lyase